MIAEHPQIFWGLIASMYIGNLMLLVLNLPLVGIFVNLLRIPYVYLAPVVLLICVVGIYSVTAKSLDIFVMAAFGVLGYVLRKFDFDVAPLLLSIVTTAIMVIVAAWESISLKSDASESRAEESQSGATSA